MDAFRDGATVLVLRALGLLALAACGGGTADSPIAAVHDPCAPLALVSAGAGEAELRGIVGGEQLWRDQGVTALGLRAGSTIEVRFESAAPAFHGQYDDEADVIYVNRAIDAEATMSIVIAHELGHAFGLAHVTDRASVMNPGNLTVIPNDADRVALGALWGTCD